MENFSHSSLVYIYKFIHDMMSAFTIFLTLLMDSLFQIYLDFKTHRGKLNFFYISLYINISKQGNFQLVTNNILAFGNFCHFQREDA